MKDSYMQAKEIVEQMLEKDFFSKWLGIEVVKIGEGKCVLQMKIRPEMLNGFGIAHGGITYSLADSCLAFASNSYGNHAVSVETSIAHLHPVRKGDVLLAKAEEISKSSKIGHYVVEVIKSSGERVAFFKGIVYIKRENWRKD